MKRCKILAILLLTVFFMGACGVGATDVQPIKSVHVVMPDADGIGSPDANYFKNWLEKQTGIKIELELVTPEYMSEYLRLLFSPGNTSDVDAVFLNGDYITMDEVEAYGQQNYILPLNDMIDDRTNLSTIYQAFPSLRSLVKSSDGNDYFMPNFTYSEVFRTNQVLWMNAAWLRDCGVAMPQTTEEFREVLRAFQNSDPNGNGKQDEVPVAGNYIVDTQNICYFLMNSFVYASPDNTFMAVEDGRVYFAAATDEWREGLRYLRSLYDEGLLSTSCFSFSDKQFTRIINDQRNLVGGFAAQDVSDVLAAGSPALSSRYIHVPPLMGPDGVRFSILNNNKPTPGGFITKYCDDPETVFELMDFMLGQKACLIAAFGEQGDDWDYSDVSEIAFDGKQAQITVQSPEWDLVQNKTFARLGPFIGYPSITDGVAWNGYQSDQRYLNARAARVYQEYEPVEYIRALQTTQQADDVRQLVKSYVSESMLQFATGRKEIEDDAQWRDYLEELRMLGVDELVSTVQMSYGMSKTGG